MAICDSLSQQVSPNAHAPNSGKGCSADNYRVFVSMYCYVAFRTFRILDQNNFNKPWITDL